MRLAAQLGGGLPRQGDAGTMKSCDGALCRTRPHCSWCDCYLLIWSIWVRTALTTRMASEGSVPALQALRAAVRLSTCGDEGQSGQCKAWPRGTGHASGATEHTGGECGARPCPPSVWDAKDRAV